MFTKLRNLRDRIVLWLTLKLHLDIPDLQQTARPKPGVIYYYIGRLVRLVANPRPLRLRSDNLTVEELRILRECNQFDVKEVQRCQELRTHIYDEVCAQCILHKLSLPCHKVHNYRCVSDGSPVVRRVTIITQPKQPQDLCMYYHYELIKGLPEDYETINSKK